MHKTNWYVITGVPCSGKTAVICKLEQLGYRVVHEVARAYVVEELEKGRTIEMIKADILTFEQHILSRKMAIEELLSEYEVVFLDRAIPDSIAYYNLAGLVSEEPIKKSKIKRYNKIFFFERLTFERDSIRLENDKTATKLNILLEQGYRMIGYDIVRVPLLSVDDRVDFILKLL